MTDLSSVPSLLPILADGALRLFLLFVLGTLGFWTFVAQPAWLAGSGAGLAALSAARRLAGIGALGLIATTLCLAGLTIDPQEAIAALLALESVKVVALAAIATLSVLILFTAWFRLDAINSGLTLYWFCLLAVAAGLAVGDDVGTMPLPVLETSAALAGLSLVAGAWPALLTAGHGLNAPDIGRLCRRTAGVSLVGVSISVAVGLTSAAWEATRLLSPALPLSSDISGGWLWLLLIATGMAWGLLAVSLPASQIARRHSAAYQPRLLGLRRLAILGTGLAACLSILWADAGTIQNGMASAATPPSVAHILANFSFEPCDLSKPRFRTDGSIDRAEADNFDAVVSGQGVSENPWQLYTERWAGLIVLIIGFLALLDQAGDAPWSRYWPLVLLALSGFLLNQSDPGTWPTAGLTDPAGLGESGLLRNRLFVLALVLIAIVEWMLRAGYVPRPTVARASSVCLAIAATLAMLEPPFRPDLGHDTDRIFLQTVLSSVGLLAAASRWLEGTWPNAPTIVTRVWPLATIAIGLGLLLYRPV